MTVSTTTIKQLFGFSQNQCAEPDCTNAMIEMDEKTGKAVVYGKIAHIHGQKPGAERFFQEVYDDKERLHGFGEPPLSGPCELLVHDGSLVHRDDAFWCGRFVSEGAVRSDGVVVAAPLFDQDLSLAKRAEDFAAQQFISEAGVEAFTVPVLPRVRR